MSLHEKRTGKKVHFLEKKQEGKFSAGNEIHTMSGESMELIESLETYKDPKTMANRCLQVGDLLLLRGDAEKAHELYREALYLSRVLTY